VGFGKPARTRGSNPINSGPKKPGRREEGEGGTTKGDIEGLREESNLHKAGITEEDAASSGREDRKRFRSGPRGRDHGFNRRGEGGRPVSKP